MSHLRLVSSFHTADYPYVTDVDTTALPKIYMNIEELDSSFFTSHYNTRLTDIRSALNVAMIDDHFIVQEPQRIRVFLKSEQDCKDLQVALSHDDEWVHVLEEETQKSLRALNGLRRELTEAWSIGNLKGRFSVSVKQDLRGLEVKTADKSAYFQIQRHIKNLFD